MATFHIENFPHRLYERLREAAEREHRSIAQQVTHLLEMALEPPTTVGLVELEGLGAEIWEGLGAPDHVALERDSWG
jgi:plasmid stability protein